MDKIKCGNAAFPAASGPYGNEGMMLRDYFAIRALPLVYQDAMLQEGRSLEEKIDMACDEAYRIADVMLKARGGEEVTRAFVRQPQPAAIQPDPPRDSRRLR